VTVIEQMQKVVLAMSNEDEDAVLAGIARIAELEAALKIAFAAIGVARSISSVRAEFDFDPAYDAVRNVLLPDKRN
jgi:hypothetical protein